MIISDWALFFFFLNLHIFPVTSILTSILSKINFICREPIGEAFSNAPVAAYAV